MGHGGRGVEATRLELQPRGSFPSKFVLWDAQLCNGKDGETKANEQIISSVTTAALGAKVTLRGGGAAACCPKETLQRVERQHAAFSGGGSTRSQVGVLG